jgi:head decoration protein D
MPINTLTFTAQKLEPFNYPEHAEKAPIKLAPSLTLTKGTVLGRITASDLWAAYNNALATGVEVARAILMYDVVTDAQGNHFYGAQASSEHGEAHSHAPAYISGNFRAADLVGLDAAAVTDFAARLIYGDTIADPNAVIHIG